MEFPIRVEGKYLIISRCRASKDPIREFGLDGDIIYLTDERAYKDIQDTYKIISKLKNYISEAK